MNKPKISIVVSVGKNREIGRDNDLLWDIAEDRKRFKEITMGHVVIWGRKTFESVLTYIHKAPPGRTNIIITRDKDGFLKSHPELISGSEIPNQVRNDHNGEIIIVHSFEEAFRKAKELEKEEIFIGGGGQIYKQAMEAGIVDCLYLTIVEGNYESDTFFPDYSGFEKVSEEKHDNGEYKFKFINLQR